MSLYSANEVIEFAVQIEKNGYAFYDEAAKRKDLDQRSRDFLIYLRDQELNHEKSFLALRTDDDLAELNLAQDWEMVSNYMRAIIEGRIFDSPEAAIKKAASAKSLLEIVDNAIAFEKDTLLFFHAINDGVTNPKVQAVLRRIITEEVSHVLQLNDFKKTIV